MSMIWFCPCFLFAFALCDEHTHTYEDHEEVVLWMNTIGPYRNRQETYAFFDLPFCRGPKQSIEHEHETLGEALQGVELQHSGIEIHFKDDVLKKEICTFTLDRDSDAKFRSAIVNHYWYQMYLDDLPLWSIVGDISKENKPLIWTHKELVISYNQNRIVKVVVMNSQLHRVEPNVPISFTYSVKWQPSDLSFDRRYDEYLDFDFFKHRVHWFSIFNSFMMVIFLVTLVFMILMRTLRRDYARYNKEDGLGDVDRELGDEYGWKQIHGDVFRTSAHPTLLSSLVGSGAHLVVVTFAVLLLALFNRLYTERGGIVSTGICVFAATSPVNGLVGGSLYAQMSGKHWIRQFLTSASLLPTLVCSAAFVVNIVAVYYHVSRAIPFLTMVVVVLIVLFVVVPLNLVGTVLGRNLFRLPNYPCRVNSVPRPIPEKKWFMEPGFIVLVTGILPFGSIFIELYLILTSFWAYKIYFVYGFTMLVFFIVLVVTASVAAVGIYLLLNSEDYRWQWTSFLSGASVSIYAYMYAIYYFFFKTKMSGLFQTSFYFVYMALFCISLGIMCGSVGFLATQKFVRKIYSFVKVD